MLNKFLSTDIRHTKYYLVRYNDKYFRLLKNKYQLEKGWELLEKVEKLTEPRDKKEIERISLSRCKREIRELALSNDFEYFGTITVNNYFCNRYELSDCQSKLKSILKKIKRNNFDFKYLIITEKHKDGAFHFHGLFSGLDLVCNSNNYWESPELSNLGFNSFSPIRDYNKCCNYITKYITKDCVKNSHNQIYFRSKNLKFATKEEIGFIEPNWKFDNDFVSIYDLDLTNLTENDRLVLVDIMNATKKK